MVRFGSTRHGACCTVRLRGWAAARRAQVPGNGGLTSRSSRCRFAARLNSGVRHHMSALSTTDALVLVPVAVLAIAAIAQPANRRLRIASVTSLVLVALCYTVLRPSARAARTYYESSGGVWSEQWLAGVQSMLAVTRHMPTVVLLAALLLAVIALRSR